MKGWPSAWWKWSKTLAPWAMQRMKQWGGGAASHHLTWLPAQGLPRSAAPAWGKLEEAAWLLLRPYPPSPASTGARQQGFLPHWPIWGSFPTLPQILPVSTAPQWPHSSLAALQRHTLSSPRHWLETHQGRRVTPERHSTGIRLELHLQKGFLVN